MMIALMGSILVLMIALVGSILVLVPGWEASSGPFPNPWSQGTWSQSHNHSRQSQHHLLHLVKAHWPVSKNFRLLTRFHQTSNLPASGSGHGEPRCIVEDVGILLAISIWDSISTCWLGLSEGQGSASATMLAIFLVRRPLNNGAGVVILNPPGAQPSFCPAQHFAQTHRTSNQSDWAHHSGQD